MNIGMQGTADDVVRCRDLMQTYGSGPTAVHALRDLDLDVRAGELLILVGASGCGKTTLISVIAGLLAREAGECEVLGRDIAMMAPKERVRFRGANVGLVFQNFDLIPTLSAAENAAVPLVISGESRRHSIDRARCVLGDFGFDERMTESLPAKLSGGQQQRVAIARAMIHNPRLILCDEPTSALDSETGQSIMELMRRAVREDNRALVIVTHDDRILHFADRIAQMEDGRITEVHNKQSDSDAEPGQE